MTRYDIEIGRLCPSQKRIDSNTAHDLREDTRRLEKIKTKAQKIEKLGMVYRNYIINMEINETTS